MKVFLTLVLAVIAVSAAPSSLHNLGIVGGRDANIGEFPYIVSLERSDLPDNEHKHLCGGVIISPTTILTAGHCVTGTGMMKVISISAGVHNLTEEDHSQRIDVDKFIIHPDFNLTLDSRRLISLNDIALIKLKDTITYNSNVTAIGLPEPAAAVPDEVDVIAAGWGYKFDSHNDFVTPDILQTVGFKALSYDNCYSSVKDIVGDRETIQLSLNSTQCVGPLTDKNGPVDSAGDSGGPLVLDNTIVGVASWTVNYWSTSPIIVGKKGPAGVYTKVSAYVDWIKQNVNDL